MSTNFKHIEEETNQIIAWLRQAGQIAMKYFNTDYDVSYKADDTFITQVDLAVEDFLVERIRRLFPRDGFISEEGARSNNTPTAKRLWVIDPLDGTTTFVRGLPGWGISVGLLEDDRPTCGFFYMPLLDDLTYTVGRDEVRANQRDLRGAVQPDWRRKGFLAVSSSAHHDFEIAIRRTHTTGGAVSSLIYTARGSAVAAFIPKARLWDLTAGAAILHRAGGALRYLSGREIDYMELLDGNRTPEPVIAGHPEVLDALQKAIRPRSAP